MDEGSLGARAAVCLPGPRGAMAQGARRPTGRAAAPGASPTCRGSVRCWPDLSICRSGSFKSGRCWQTEDGAHTLLHGVHACVQLHCHAIPSVEICTHKHAPPRRRTREHQRCHATYCVRWLRQLAAPATHSHASAAMRVSNTDRRQIVRARARRAAPSEPRCSESRWAVLCAIKLAGITLLCI